MTGPVRTEVAIVEYLPDDTGAGILKIDHGYLFRMIYRLETGELVPTTRSKRLQRDAKAFIASLPKLAEHSEHAMFHDGEFVGTRSSFTIGGQR